VAMRRNKACASIRRGQRSICSHRAHYERGRGTLSHCECRFKGCIVESWRLCPIQREGGSQRQTLQRQRTTTRPVSCGGHDFSYMDSRWRIEKSPHSARVASNEHMNHSEHNALPPNGVGVYRGQSEPTTERRLTGSLPTNGFFRAQQEPRYKLWRQIGLHSIPSCAFDRRERETYTEKSALPKETQRRTSGR